DLLIPGAVDDVNDVPVAWHAGFVPALPPRGAQASRGHYFVLGHPVQRGRGIGVLFIRVPVGTIRTPPCHAGRLSLGARRDSCVVVWRNLAHACDGSFPDADGRTGSLGNYSRASE